jgi:hypothetical protein
VNVDIGCFKITTGDAILKRREKKRCIIYSSMEIFIYFGALKPL